MKSFADEQESLKRRLLLLKVSIFERTITAHY
jgi:hypothetical protein